MSAVIFQCYEIDQSNDLFSKFETFKHSKNMMLEIEDGGRESKSFLEMWQQRMKIRGNCDEGRDKETEKKGERKKTFFVNSNISEQTGKILF